MIWNDRDLTIETALADPVIGAMMRADRVDAQRLEASLRATARRLDTARRASAAPIGEPRRPACMALCAW